MVLWLALVGVTPAAAKFVFRPPAIPLITADPFMQTFVNGDTVTSDVVRHWTGTPKETIGLVRIDNQSHAFLGQQILLPSLIQKSVTAHASRTVVELELPNVLSLQLTFLQTAFTDDVYRLARPVYYVTFKASSLDNQPHSVQVYFDATAQHVVNHCITEAVQWKSWAAQGLVGAKLGSATQPVLGAACDECNINWGWLHLAVASSSSASSSSSSSSAAAAPAVRGGSARQSREQFLITGKLPTVEDVRLPRMCADDLPALALAHDLGAVGASAVELTAALGYDEVDAAYYFGERLEGLWRRNYSDISTAMAHALDEHPAMLAKSVAQDDALYASMCKAGGKLCDEYASLGALAYRQTLGALKLVWVPKRNDWWAFLKEMSTNGDMQTMDVIYPGSPMLLALRPEILRKMLVPVLAYAANETWHHFGSPYSPHQLGTYPIANATTAQQEPMPLENSGNMLFMLLALAQAQGVSYTTRWLSTYLPMLRSWTDELVRTSEFPANQLCTDDFTGRLPNNTNLGAKGIIAIQAFGELCATLDAGRTVESAAPPLAGCGDDYKKFKTIASKYAQTWHDHAYNATPAPHYGMSFNAIKGVNVSWSIKYNLLWQKLLKLDGPFPEAVFSTEVAFYRAHANPYGVPLDPRHGWVKTDWLSWAACLSGASADFEAIFAPIFLFANTTASRAPFTDLYDTVTAKQSLGGFIARFVIGGIFARMLMV